MIENKEFEQWWDAHGQYVRAGDGQYEISFAFAAWQHQSARIAELEAQLIAEAARTAEQKLRADQLEQQHAMQAKMHAQVAEQWAAAQQAVEVTDDMALAFHQALTDGALGADELEDIKTGLRAALANVYATHPATQGLDVQVQNRLDRLYLALEVCSAELFAQCAHQGRAMKYVDQARYALAAEKCARAAQAKQGGV